MRLAGVACALGLAACTSERGGPTYDITKVTSTCEPRTPALCAVRAEIGTRFPADTLAVVALADGDRELARAVVPVSDGRGVAEWAGVEGSSPPQPRVRVLGTVVVPADGKLAVVDVATSCAASSTEGGTLGCRTTGRVESSLSEPLLVVVEARSSVPETPWWKRDEGARAWALVRVVDGKGTFSIDWRRPRGQAHSPEADVRARGFVGHLPPRG